MALTDAYSIVDRCRFNRNIVECKFNTDCGSISAHLDLIETQWNVNHHQSHTARKRPRLNRNIVECKLQESVAPTSMDTRFNRNIVECKCKCFLFFCCRVKRFNRNIVECKYMSTNSCSNLAPDLIETQWNVNQELAGVGATQYGI